MIFICTAIKIVLGLKMIAEGDVIFILMIGFVGVLFYKICKNMDSDMQFLREET